MLVFFILMIFTCCSSEAYPGVYYKSEVPVINPVVTTTKHCVCYNISGSSVADALHTDQQRLVVYLYKDANNNLKAYTPSKEKQLLLPDLGIGKGDVFIDLGPDSVLLQQLFNPKIAVELKRNNVLLNLNQYSSKGQMNEDLINYFNPQDEINNSNSQFKDEVGVYNPINSDEPPADLEDDDNNLPSVDEKLPILDEVSATDPETSVGVSAETSLDEQEDLFVPYKDTPMLEEPVAGKFTGSKNDLMSESDLGLQLQTIPVDESLIPRPEAVKFSMKQIQQQLDNKDFEYFTFDKWFDQQMQKIQKIGTSPKKNLNLFSLKQQIEKTLFDNGMYVTNDGVLIDSKLQALNVANLKLRPILIGDSVAYDSVFTVNNRKYELPSNLPYLEALLVTLVTPPKILGVIPLGKTYVPRVSYRRNFDFLDLVASSRQASAGSICKTGTCLIQQLKAINNCKTGKCPQNKYFQMLHRRNYPNSSRFPVRTGNDVASNQAQPASKSKIYTSSSQKKHSSKGGNYIIPQLPQNNGTLLGFLNSLLDLDKVQKNGKVFSDYMKVGEEDVSEEKQPEEDGLEVPWFRIIGGNAATSSGTPVSSRGRSGYHY